MNWWMFGTLTTSDGSPGWLNVGNPPKARGLFRHCAWTLSLIQPFNLFWWMTQTVQKVFQPQVPSPHHALLSVHSHAQATEGRVVTVKHWQVLVREWVSESTSVRRAGLHLHRPRGLFCQGVGWIDQVVGFFDEYFGTSIIGQFVTDHSFETYHTGIQWCCCKECYVQTLSQSFNYFCQRKTKKKPRALSIRCICTGYVHIPTWQWRLGASDYLCTLKCSFAKLFLRTLIVES